MDEFKSAQQGIGNRHGRKPASWAGAILLVAFPVHLAVASSRLYVLFSCASRSDGSSTMPNLALEVMLLAWLQEQYMMRQGSGRRRSGASW